MRNLNFLLMPLIDPAGAFKIAVLMTQANWYQFHAWLLMRTSDCTLWLNWRRYGGYRT